MKGLTMQIVHFPIHKHRPVAVHWEKETKKGLDRHTDMGVM